MGILTERWKNYNKNNSDTWPKNGDFVLADLGGIYELTVFKNNTFLIAVSPDMTGQPIGGIKRYQKISL